MSQPINSNVKYIATVKNVREIALLGTADLKYWQSQLAQESLQPIPTPDGNHAQILLTTISAKWRGNAFREFAVAIAACPQSSHNSAEGVGESTSNEHYFFFAAAFNSSRIFTFFERHWFHTPYQCRKDLQLALDATPSFQLGSSPHPDIHAQLASRSPKTIPEQIAIDYPCKLFIPRKENQRPDQLRYFNILLQGLTTITNYDPTQDQFEIAINTKIPILNALKESNFQPTQWHLRTNATHARSKTGTLLLESARG